MKAISILSVLVAILIFANDSYACSCGYVAVGTSDQTLVEEAKEKADVIFIGEIVGVRFSESTSNTEPFTRYAKFKVEKAWKGVEDEFIEISTGNICCICGVEFEKGQRYLIYAYKTESGEYDTNICTRTRIYKQDNVDEKYLGEPIKINKEENLELNSENVSDPVPIVFGSADDGYPETMKVRGVIKELTFAQGSCGIFSWSGTLRIELIQKIKDYHHNDVFVVVSCFGDSEKFGRNAEKYLNKEIELKVHKIYPSYRFSGSMENKKIPCGFGTISNKINSEGTPFYCTDFENSGISKLIEQTSQ